MLQFNSSLLFYKLTFFLLFTLYCPTWAEPFLSPDNPFIRHEIRLIIDEGSLNEIPNTWPLNLGGLSYGLSTNSIFGWKHSLLEKKIAEEKESGLGKTSSSFSVRDDRMTSRGFYSGSHSFFSSNISTSWMDDRFAVKMSLNAFYGVKKDWKNRIDEGFAIDGSYVSARLGNWSATIGKVGRWWGPGWDGSLILSTNARPIPAVSVDRRISEPFEAKWLSWIGPWSFHSFIGRMEGERTVPNPYLWGMRGEVQPTILGGLEIGFFRMMQLGGDGRPEGLSTWVDAFLSQDNTGANTGKDPYKEPGNQLAGIDIRWKPFGFPFAFYGQIVGEDEDKFLPNCLMFQYGIEAWTSIENSTLRVFAEYVDLTSYWWTGDPRTRNITYGHHIYSDGYRFRGRPLGHWGDQDSRLTSIGGLWLINNELAWGSTLRIGKLNVDGAGQSSVSNFVSTDYLSIEIFNAREYENLSMSINKSLGWENMSRGNNQNDNGLTAFLSLTRSF